MLSFKTFIDESFNIPLDEPDNTDIGKLIDYLQKKNIASSDLVMISNTAGKVKIRREFEPHKDEILKFISDNGLSIPFASTKFGDGSIGSGGKKISENTQELMVACLVLMKYSSNSLDEAEALKVIEDSKKYFGKIIGATGKSDLLEQFDNNFNDLATAISSSNSILSIVPNPTHVYWTGKGWHKDIEKFNPPLGNIKDYNSSDIVVKGSDGKFYGFSLKKKKTTKEVDPTLINKPVSGSKSLLIDIVGKNDLDKIERAKNIFFDLSLKKYFGREYSLKDLKNMSERERNKLINEIPTKAWSVFLRNPRNVFYRTVEEVITKNGEEFVTKFLNLIFRTKINELVDASEFTFYLLTGIGKFANKKVVVEPAETKDLNTVIEALQGIFDKNPTVQRTKGKIQAYEPKAGAAKLFFTIYSGRDALIDIEIRYKGSYTAAPQFQAVATPNFKSLFKK